MQWDDVGYLVSKNQYNENSLISEFYTKDHGKCAGIIFGATSKKIKNYLQVGNKLYLNYNYKTEGKLGYFKVEIFKVHSPYYFEFKDKLLALVSAMNLIKLLTVELQANILIFNLIEDFYLIFNQEDWIKEYIFWELKLLKLLGYNLELEKISHTEIINNKKRYFVKTNSEKKYIPNFLIDKNKNNLEKSELLKGLKLVGDFLEKNVLQPNNIKYPLSRFEFINLIK